jgi:hypothetical protein
MRVWDVPPAELCDRHLVGEHAEIHAVWSVIKNAKRGYAKHPEVMRWRDHTAALAARHGGVAAEMELRGFRHRSPLSVHGGGDAASPLTLLNTLAEQRELLRAKRCHCFDGRAAEP